MSVCSIPSSPDLNALCAQALPAVTRRARMLLPPSEVEDVVQETFVAALAGMDAYREEAGFVTWLCAILRHKTADYYRQRGAPTANLDTAPQPLTTDWRTGLELRLLLADLPDDYREVLALRFDAGLKFCDVARALGISHEATKSRYRRAVDCLRQEWDA